MLNVLELSWGGTKAHTNQGFNIGKPPYGYAAVKTRHPVKNKAGPSAVWSRIPSAGQWSPGSSCCEP